MFSKILENFLVCEGWGVCGVEFQNGKFGGGLCWNSKMVNLGCDGV